MEETESIKYCLYARKSSEQDERQAMSIDSQLKEMADLALAKGLKVVKVKKESHSAKMSAQRPVFMEMLQEIRNEEYNGILTWAPDRLSRNAGDPGSLVDLMDAKKLAHIKTHSQEFGNNPNEKFLLMILFSQAKLENDNRGINVKRGIRAKCEMGWRPCMPPLGYFTRAATGKERDVIIDEDRAPYIKQMFEMSADGKSGRYIQRWLISNNVHTRGDKNIPLSAIYRMLKSHYYYGEFEYPKGSNNWYKGKHEPLITKELFDKVQKALIVPPKSKWGEKEFPFKGFIKCYSCGSSLVGEQKIKTNKNGGVREYTYYHCSRQVDHDCKELFARESDIVDQLYEMRNELIPNKDALDKRLKNAVSKTADLSGVTLDAAFDIYIRYVLHKGSKFEQTQLVRNISQTLALHERKIILL